MTLRKARLVEERGAEDHEGVEPAPGLVDGLGDEVRGEVRSKRSLFSNG